MSNTLLKTAAQWWIDKIDGHELTGESTKVPLLRGQKKDFFYNFDFVLSRPLCIDDEVELACDHKPNKLLAEILIRSNIPFEYCPKKTTMIIWYDFKQKRDRIEVSYGDGVKFEIISES